jgi:DNA-binding response OmpR family regulator
VDSADRLGALLRLKGHETEVAYDGLAALEAAERFRPEVILLDIGLPKLSGLDVCRRIREQPWGAGVLLVALTGWGQEEVRRNSKEAGFDSHLVKPVDLESLLRLVTAPY